MNADSEGLSSTAPAWDCDEATRAAFARLEPESAAPVAVAYSGGGDSLALLLIAKAWADGAGRRLIALSVDHGLHPDSGGWTRACSARCAGLGVEHRTLIWSGRKPRTGVADAARTARHGLIAEAARAAGGRVVLMGHTANDLAENAAMSEEGVFVTDPKVWAPSPIWPEGRGVFLLRPLLSVRRRDLRAWLTARGERWIEDPANVDPRTARARARAALALDAPPRREFVCGTPLIWALEAKARGDPPPPAWTWAGAYAAFVLENWRSEPQRLGRAVACAGGRADAPETRKLQRLCGRPGDFTATLGGARLQATGASLTVAREAGEMSRFGRPASTTLIPGEATVWDGRFEIVGHEPGLRVVALAGRAARLAPADRAALAQVPAIARPSLPAILDASGVARLSSVVSDPRVSVRDLAGERFAASIGDIPDEATAWRMAKARAIS